jgi:hypothetical protein
MIELLYLYFVITVGYFMLFIQYTFLEQEYISYRKGINTTLIKINNKFELFEFNELDNIELMNIALDKISLN